MTFAYRYGPGDTHPEGEHRWWCNTIGNTDTPHAGDYECDLCGKQVTTTKHRPNRMGCKGYDGDEEE